MPINKTLLSKDQIKNLTVDWGTIQGDINNQTDLLDILNNKSDTDHNHDNLYLPINGTAADATLLDGKLPSYYTTAANITYDNSISGLTSTNVQNAIDELVTNLPTPGEGASALSELSDVSIATKADGDALVYVEADSKWKAVNLRKVNEVVKSSTATLTTAEVTGTIINNYGQDDDTTLTLPTAAKGLTFMVVLGTEVDNYFHIKPDTNDKIYLNGTAGADGEYVGVSSAVAGSAISFTAFKTGTDTYDWLAVPIAGDWEAES